MPPPLLTVCASPGDAQEGVLKAILIWAPAHGVGSLSRLSHDTPRRSTEDLTVGEETMGGKTFPLLVRERHAAPIVSKTRIGG
jgi:hypothetical protein